MEELNREIFGTEENMNGENQTEISTAENETPHQTGYGHFADQGYAYQGYEYPYQDQYMNAYGNQVYPYQGNANYGYVQANGMNANYAHGEHANVNYATPGYRNQNINGMEAMYISQNMTNAEEAAKHVERYSEFENVSSETEKLVALEEGIKKFETEQTDTGFKSRTEKTGKSHSGVGKKIARLIAAAVIFGLVAGAVFQGVRYGSDAIIAKNKESKKAGTTDPQNQDITDYQNTPYIEANSNSIQTVNYDVSGVAANVMPSIVSITGTYVQTYQYWFTTYEQELPGAGSGIIIGRDDDYLFILTNYHVVEGAKELEVVFVDDESVEAIVKGYDKDNDVAIVLVPLEDIKDETLEQIQEITVGSSDNLRIGDPCIAIGNALGYGQSVTVGYISALEREITVSDGRITVLQTDAAINPGNSGGALVNMNGELIGVNTAKGIGSDVEGMGYALPISHIQDIINGLLAAEGIQETEDPEPVASNKIESGQTYLGISASTLSKDYAEMLNMPEGIYISTITKDSPAEDCGLEAGDIIVGFDGEEVTDMTVLQRKVADKKPGDEVKIEFYRLADDEYEKLTVTATLQAME